MQRTLKADWLTNYLASSSCWVGGRPLQDKKSDFGEVLRTIRYFRGHEQTFTTVVVLEFSHDSRNSPQESLFELALQDIHLPANFVLGVWRNDLNDFSIYKEGKYEMKVSSNRVLQTFAEFDSSIVGNSKNLKPINRSFTDSFHIWARNNMKGFQNDVDAYAVVDTRVHIMELKRPTESIESWRPYMADAWNYINLGDYSKFCSGEMTTIAYNESTPGKIKILKDIEIQRGRFMRYKQGFMSFTPAENILTKMKDVDFSIEISNR